MTNDLRLYDSITDAKDDARDCIGVSGSHGGLFAAAVASRAGLRAVILNDAGKGLNDAGLAGVRTLADLGMAACTVDCHSAEIGSASDSLANGIISFANAVAASLGVRPGQSVTEALDLLSHAPRPTGIMDAVPEARLERVIGGIPVLCVDSASLITPEDRGRIIVTGSHGGLIGGDPARACKAQARYVAFSDAGRGKNDVGLRRLPALEARGIAASTVDCMTAEIGNARSMLESGVISAANQQALDYGICLGMPHETAIRMISKSVFK